MMGNIDFDAYRRYMRRRRYSKEVMWARVANARRWVRWCDDWRNATFEDVEDWIAEHDVTPATARNLLGYVRAFYRWAIRYDLTDRDPTRLCDPIKVPRRLPRPAPDDEIGRVLEQADQRTGAMIALMAGAGLRCCEVSRLNWSDVDMFGRRIRVIGKGDKERVLDLSDDVWRVLARLDTGEAAIFTGRGGRRLSPARVSQIVCRAFDAVGAPEVVAHQLRHRFATIAFDLPDAELYTVSQLLGHSSVATTQIYTAIVPGRTSAMSRAIPLPLIRHIRDV